MHPDIPMSLLEAYLAPLPLLKQAKIMAKAQSRMNRRAAMLRYHHQVAADAMARARGGRG